MKKLLLGTMMAALFIGDADASTFSKKLGRSFKSVTNGSQYNAKANEQIYQDGLGSYFSPVVIGVFAKLKGLEKAFEKAESLYPDEGSVLADAGILFREVAGYMDAIYRSTDAKKLKAQRLRLVDALTKDQALYTGLRHLKSSGFWKDNEALVKSDLVYVLNSLQALARPEENWNAAGNVFSVKNGPNKGQGGEPVLGETPDYKLQGKAPEFSPVDEIASIFEKALGFSSNDRLKKSESRGDEDVDAQGDREASIDDEDVTPQRARKNSRRSRSVNEKTEEMESSPKVSRRSFKRSKSTNDISDSRSNRRSLRKSRSMNDFDD